MAPMAEQFDQEIMHTIIESIHTITGEQQDIPYEKNLIEVGINSIQLIQIIVMLEEQLDITFLDEDLLLDKFETVAKIYEMVQAQKH
jgi:acyl carrier protein